MALWDMYQMQGYDKAESIVKNDSIRSVLAYVLLILPCSVYEIGKYDGHLTHIKK